MVPPGTRRLLRTFATHIWRFKDSRSEAPVTQDVRAAPDVTEFEVGLDTQCVRLRTDRRGGLRAIGASGLVTPKSGAATPTSEPPSPAPGLAPIPDLPAA